jgi:porin
MEPFRLNHLSVTLLGLLCVVSVSSSLGDSDDLQQDDFRAEDRGGVLSIEPIYYGELFTNARGGKATKNATRYQGLLDLGIRLDLEASRMNLPGSLFLLAQNTHGRGLTEDFIGDTLVISNIDSFENILHVGEYWWESRWMDDDLTLRLGKQDFNTEFQRIDGAEYFIQSTFGLSPSTAFPTYPNQAMGAVALWNMHDSLKLKVGAWSAFARAGTWGFSDSDAFLVVGELERLYSLADGSLPGIVSVGAVYESAGEIDGQAVSAVRE